MRGSAAFLSFKLKTLFVQTIRGYLRRASQMSEITNLIRSLEGILTRFPLMSRFLLEKTNKTTMRKVGFYQGR